MGITKIIKRKDSRDMRIRKMITDQIIKRKKMRERKGR